MDLEGNTFNLYSENLYRIKADSLICSISNRCIEGVENIFAVIEPHKLSLMEMDNSSLHVGFSPYLGREFLERKGVVEDDKRQEILSFYRGLIFNYPECQLTVEFNKDNSKIICDIIRVRGGFQRKSPYFGYAPFAIDFIVFAPNGEVQIVKQISTPDEYDTFVIKEIPKIGQVLYRKFAGIRSLDAIDLEDYIDGVSRSYTMCGTYNWKNVKGDISHDSRLSSLDLQIDLKHHLATLYNTTNLYYREFQVISHASFDPGPDDCYESRDKYIWAAFSFDESFLLNFLAKMATVSTFTFEKGYFDSKIVFTFNDVMTKSKFEELTGIHLSELIEETSG